MRPFAIALLLAVGVPAHAEPASGTVPDVVAGERYDGRAPQPSAKRALLAVPRLILAVPRLVVRGIGAALRPPMHWLERSHAIERVTAAFTTDDGLIGVRPVIAYQSSFRPAFGLSLFDRRLPGKSELLLSVATGGPGVVLAESHLMVPIPPSGSRVGVDVTYTRRDDELYTGIGMESALPFARYGVDRVDAKTSVAVTPIKRLTVDASAGFGLRRFNPGSSYGDEAPIDQIYCHSFDGRCMGGVDERLVPGYAEGTTFFRERLGLHLDSRPDEMSSGLVVDAAATYTHGLGDDASSYLELRAGVGTNFEIWRRRTIYVSVTAADQIGFGKTPIPFSELEQLGGPDDLRGFRRGRYRDQSMLLGTVEYRWPIWMWMDGSLFGDWGGVFAEHFNDISFGKLRGDVGLGVRVKTGNRYLFRAQVAYGFGADGHVMFVLSGNPT